MENKEIDTSKIIEEFLVDDIPMLLGKSVEEENIAMMKAADLTEILKSGGQLATDEEYEEAEIEFQRIAQRLMEV